MSAPSNNAAVPAADRFEAPMYLARFRDRQDADIDGPAVDDDAVWG